VLRIDRSDYAKMGESLHTPLQLQHVFLQVGKSWDRPEDDPYLRGRGSELAGEAGGAGPACNSWICTVYAQKRNLMMVVTSEIHDDEDDRSIISFLATEIVLPDMP
jgi:hypothetical protein